MNAPLALHRVSKRFHAHQALAEVDLTVVSAEILGLVGPNGAGKTTLLRLMAGLLKPSAGTIERPVPTISGSVRYFAGEHSLPPDVTARAWRRLWRVTAEGVDERRRLGLLSRGTRQRIGLETAMSGSCTQILLLDEPWEGLDPEASRWLAGRLMRARDEGVAVVVSSHRMHDLAAICDRCVCLASGRLVGPAVQFNHDFEVHTAAARTAAVLDIFGRASQEGPWHSS